MDLQSWHQFRLLMCRPSGYLRAVVRRGVPKRCSHPLFILAMFFYVKHKSIVRDSAVLGFFGRMDEEEGIGPLH